MPEKPEVITVAKKLKNIVKDLTIIDVKVIYNKIIEYPCVSDFINNIKNEKILDITTRGKWLEFHLTNYMLLVHLRMEGKFFFREKNDVISKHEHVIFTLSDNREMRFNDVRKFGKMMLLPKDNYLNMKPYTILGLEPWDKSLTSDYLLDKYKKKNLPIKSVLLDQSIITGIGNIYADEILFLSKINPLTKASSLRKKELESIISNTIKVLDKAIMEGGTTIRSYTSIEGVTGLFQNSLNVHAQEGKACPICNSTIIKIKVNGRGTYYCDKCQK